jgi:hypothetical protein
MVRRIDEECPRRAEDEVVVVGGEEVSGSDRRSGRGRGNLFEERHLKGLAERQRCEGVIRLEEGATYAGPAPALSSQPQAKCPDLSMVMPQNSTHNEQ